MPPHYANNMESVIDYIIAGRRDMRITADEYVTRGEIGIMATV